MFLLQDYQINGLDVNTTENCENQGGTNGINGGQQGQFSKSSLSCLKLLKNVLLYRKPIFN